MFGGGWLAEGARGAVSNAAVQGVALATGLQSKFNFASVAAAGVGAAVGSLVGGAIEGKSFLGQQVNAGSFGYTLASATAGGIANAATRSAIEGSSFERNLIEAIPDIIGQAVGGALGGALLAELSKPSKDFDTNLARITRNSEREFTAHVESEKTRIEALPDGPEKREALDELQQIAEQGVDPQINFGAALAATVQARGLNPGTTRVRDVIDINKYENIIPGDRPETPGPNGENEIVVTAYGFGIHSESSIGRVIVDAAVYAQQKVESVHPIVRDIAVTSVRALLTGGSAALINLAIEKAAPAVLSNLPPEWLKPIAEAGAAFNRFIGDAGGSFLLDRDIRFCGQSLTGDSVADSRLAFGGSLGRADRRYRRRMGSDRAAAAA